MLLWLLRLLHTHGVDCSRRKSTQRREEESDTTFNCFSTAQYFLNRQKKVEKEIIIYVIIIRSMIFVGFPEFSWRPNLSSFALGIHHTGHRRRLTGLFLYIFLKFRLLSTCGFPILFVWHWKQWCPANNKKTVKRKRPWTPFSRFA